MVNMLRYRALIILGLISELFHVKQLTLFSSSLRGAQSSSDCHPETPRGTRGGLRISWIQKILSPRFAGLRMTVLSLCLGLSAGRADVLPIQSFKTPLGLEVWLVEDHSSPVVFSIFTFPKGELSSPLTPKSLLMKMAVSHGAGVLPSSAMDRFTKETPSWGEEHSGLAKNKLVIKTTKNGLKASLELWSTLIKDPQFQKANLAHSKTQTVTTIAHYKENLELIAYIHLIDTILPELLISADFDKISQSIEALTAQDLEKENTQQFLSTKPKIVVVGNVTKKELIDLLDRTFGALPLHSLPSSPPSLHPQWAAKEVIIEKDIPESVVTFGQPGIHPQSKDYAQYILLQNVLHGRFFEELREKRGLIYSIHFEGHHYNTIDLLTGYFSCECAQAPHVVKFIRSEWERLKDFGITQKELSNAKLSFKRSKVLSLTSTEAVAQEYANPQAFNLGPHAAMTLLENTEKVTLEEINLFVQKVLDPKSLTFVLIGKK